MSEPRKRLYEYAVLLHTSEDTLVVVQPTVIPALSFEAVKIAAIRAVPDEATADPDLLEVLVRPFAS